MELMKENGFYQEFTVSRILDEKGIEMESAPHPKQKITVSLKSKDGNGAECKVGLLLRKPEETC